MNCKIQLTEGQHAKLKRVQKGKITMVRIRLDNSQLKNGNFTIKVDDVQKKAIQKAKRLGKGITLTISNEMIGGGPLLTTAAATILPALIPSILKVGQGIIGDIFGSGVQAKKFDEKQANEAVKILSDPRVSKAIKSAKSENEVNSILTDIADGAKELEGAGCNCDVNGSGLLDALKWGAAFMNPFGAITGPVFAGIQAVKHLSGEGAPKKEKKAPKQKRYTFKTSS